MTLDKEKNKERMQKNRAAQKKEQAARVAAQKEEERNAIIDGVVAKLGEKLPGILLTMKERFIADVQLNHQRKMSCREEAAHPAPQTPPGAIRTGGTRGRSPAMGSGNGRNKATKQEAPKPPTPPTPPTPLTPLAPL